MDNSNLKEVLSDIEKSIKHSKAAIERGEKLKRLMANPDFQDVILEGYIETEAKKLFKILTDPTGATPYTEAEISRKLDGISTFKGYVGTPDYKGTIEIEAERATQDILREEQYRLEVTAEYAESEG